MQLPAAKATPSGITVSGLGLSLLSRRAGGRAGRQAGGSILIIYRLYDKTEVYT